MRSVTKACRVSSIYRTLIHQGIHFWFQEICYCFAASNDLPAIIAAEAAPKTRHKASKGNQYFLFKFNMWILISCFLKTGTVEHGLFAIHYRAGYIS